jgi:hypothetical protein
MRARLLALPAFVRPVQPARACGWILTWFVSGVDFPESNWRFARLA